jgi:hypothetical protein
MAQLAVVMLALFAQMERTYMLERIAHARAVATAHGRRVGRPSKVDAGKLDYARRLRDDDGLTVPEIVERTGLTRSTLYRHLPPRPATALTAAVPAGERNGHDGVAESVEAAGAMAHDEPTERAVWADADDRGILQSVTWSTNYRPNCPACTRPTSGLRERNPRVGRELVVVAVAQPCGCSVDDYAAALQTGAPAATGR